MSLWIPAGENLVRHAQSGIYYVRAHVGGRDVWKSLKTDKVSVARLRRTGALDVIRARAGFITKDNLTMGQCAAVYLEQKRTEGLKPLSLKYCELSLKMLRGCLAHFDARLAEDFTAQECKVVADRLRAKYSKRRFNGALWTLRGLLAVAVRAKVIKDNPAEDIKPQKVESARVVLPTDGQFAELLERLRRLPSRANALTFARIMALTGHRPESLRRLRREHVDFKRGLVLWPPVKHNEKFNEVPMGLELREIFQALVAKHRGDGPLLPIKNPRRALVRASAEVGISPPMTSRMFRHFWTTRALEAGIPVPEVAAMRGDKDGGGMLLRTYAHPRLERMREMVNRLPGTGSNIIALRNAKSA